MAINKHEVPRVRESHEETIAQNNKKHYEQMAIQEKALKDHSDYILLNAINKKAQWLELAKQANDLEKEIRSVEDASRGRVIKQEKKPTVEQLVSEGKMIDQLYKIYEKAQSSLDKNISVYKELINAIEIQRQESLTIEAREEVSKLNGCDPLSVSQDEIQEYIEVENKEFERDLEYLDLEMSYRADEDVLMTDEDNIPNIEEDESSNISLQELTPKPAAKTPSRLQSIIHQFMNGGDAEILGSELVKVFCDARSSRGVHAIPTSSQLGILAHTMARVELCSHQFLVLNTLSEEVEKCKDSFPKNSERMQRFESIEYKAPLDKSSIADVRKVWGGAMQPNLGSKIALDMDQQQQSITVSRSR